MRLTCGSYQNPNTMLPLNDFRFGIEHEYPAVDHEGRFCDFETSSYEQFAAVIADLPVFESDYPGLRVGDLGIKNKRWYIEGFERFSEDGAYVRTDPKGFEIRTPICPSLDVAVETLAEDMDRWERAARPFGYRAAWTSFNPFRDKYVPVPELNPWEIADRSSPEERTAYMHMLTYGPDISLSHPALSTAETVDIGRKLTYYSPYIVPFSFSSPFHLGEEWGGLSRRTYYRTGARPAVLVHVPDENHVVRSDPTLTDVARIPAEVGRIEFKAFDCPRGLDAYHALGTLLLGLVLDRTLPGRAGVPDGAAHRRSAAEGFASREVRDGAAFVLDAARSALPSSLTPALAPLELMVQTRLTPAHGMLDVYHATGDIISAIGADV